MEIIDKTIESATDEVADPTNALNHGILAQAAGGVRWLRELRRYIQELSIPPKPEEQPKAGL